MSLCFSIALKDGDRDDLKNAALVGQKDSTHPITCWKHLKQPLWISGLGRDGACWGCSFYAFPSSGPLVHPASMIGNPATLISLSEGQPWITTCWRRWISSYGSGTFVHSGGLSQLHIWTSVYPNNSLVTCCRSWPGESDTTQLCRSQIPRTKWCDVQFWQLNHFQSESELVMTFVRMMIGNLNLHHVPCSWTTYQAVMMRPGFSDNIMLTSPWNIPARFPLKTTASILKLACRHHSFE